MIYFLITLEYARDKVVGTILSATRALFYSINTYIYKLIIYLYDIFIALCSGKLLKDKALNSLFGRIGVILGLVMFMYVAFSFIKVLIDPDSFNDKQKGIPNVIKKIVIVIVMLGISSYVFTLLSNVQAAILNNNVISKLIIPSNINTNAFGGLLSSELFLTFYTLNDTTVVDDSDTLAGWCTENAIDVLGNEIVNNGDFGVGYDCLDVYGDVENYSGDGTGEDFIIDYNFVFCTVVGVVVCYLLFSYCISVGIRTIQLAVLQIISPMAIISYLSPKQDNMFSKWTKIYFSTYVDVFVRIAIINFIVYLSGLVLDSWNSGSSTFWQSVGSPDGLTRKFMGVLMIIALLSFAKKAPELIKQLFPQSASNIEFGFENGAKGLGLLAGTGVGAAVGAVGGFAGGKGASRITGLLGGIGTGTMRGIKSGYGSKGVGGAISGAASSQSKANLARAQRIASGATFGERIGDSVRGNLGIQAGYAFNDSKLTAMNTLNSLINDEDVVKDYQKMYDSAVENLSKAESEHGRGSTEYRLAQSAVYNSNERLSAVKNAMFESIVNGNSISEIEYQDSNGHVVRENAISNIEANDSMKNAKANVDKVMRKNYSNRSEFKTDRQKLQAESQKLHKNGS